MKRLIAILCILAMVLAMVPVMSFAATTARFIVYSTTDMHGKCWDTDPLTGVTNLNNMLRVKSAVAQARASYGADKVFVIDNGDLYSGTSVADTQLALYEQGKSDLPLAMAACLADIKYDAANIGAADFNNTWKTMEQTRSYLKSNGVPTVCANIYDASGKNLCTPYITKSIAVGTKTLKIGILGLTNTDIPRLAPAANYPGVSFHHPDNTACSIAWEADRYVKQMKAAGCQYIIVAYHGGLGSKSGELVYGQNSENQAERMIAETTGIDLVIAGHDHSTAYTNTYVRNKDNVPVWIVNGGGTQLTRTVISVTESGGSFTFSPSVQNLDLSTYSDDAALMNKMSFYAELVKPGAYYTDIQKGSWYEAAAKNMIAKGLMGSTNTTALRFEPNTTCTRAMIVTILYSLAGKPTAKYQKVFPDVKDGQWYTAPIMWAYQTSTASGYSNGNFGVNDKITREQIAVILMSYADYIGMDTSVRANLSIYPDAYKVTWSKEAMQWAVGTRLISGKEIAAKVLLDPQGAATRAEVAVIMTNFLKKIP